MPIKTCPGTYIAQSGFGWSTGGSCMQPRQAWGRLNHGMSLFPSGPSTAGDDPAAGSSGDLESDSSFPQSAYRVNLGEHQQSNPSPSWVSSTVRQILVHPDYNRGTRAADIALVQLAEPVRHTDKILPVCLPGPSDSVPDNHMCSVTGWGRIDSEVSLPPPKMLQEVQVQLIDTAACNALYNINTASNIGRDPIKPDMICAGYAEGQRDSCQGPVCEVVHSDQPTFASRFCLQQSLNHVSSNGPHQCP
ncbi:serine protease 27-like isoform X2 [Gopherus flavomarginatus]|uniref:serine protease 27-like isoform X2 n=1 Tax=Gopherus flavomarginatus TaxID=286002 RepID=UPI0021CC3E16|nr:serine protease 27-like isoform X2 [Gopherus flavomarginatus]